MSDPSKALREGLTTGTCAAAAAAAAARALRGEHCARVMVELPDGDPVWLDVCDCEAGEFWAEASVRKDAGDDPDITDGSLVRVRIEPRGDGASEHLFVAGEGVGTVTRPGLQIPPGEPAINPVPRRMIAQALRDAGATFMRISVSIPGGVALAAQTFNPRLGIEGGLSVLGTSGRVRPYSHAALREALRLGLNLAAAAAIKAPILVPGNIGRRVAEARFTCEQDQVIEVSNDWGYMLDELAARGFEHCLLIGHPGKLAKLVSGHFNTHSKHSPSALPVVDDCLHELALPIDSGATAEGRFQFLEAADRRRLGDQLAAKVLGAAQQRCAKASAVILGDMHGGSYGEAGDLSPWVSA